MGEAKPAGAQYHCDYCARDISKDIRIRCAECDNFDLCLECFSVGVEIKDHLNSHAYHVVDLLNFPVFNLEWTAQEELSLLEGVEIYGLGNWGDISDYVTTKVAVDCEKHYWATYIDTPTFPLPDCSKTFTEEEMEFVANQPRESVKAKNPQHPKPQPSLPVDPDLGGYMPRRGDFEVEYWNDAEYLIKDVVFDPNETEAETELKLKVLEVYNKKLNERYEMRKFIIDNELHDAKKRCALERKRTKQDKELFNKTRPLLQLTNLEKYSDFLDGLIAEKECRARITELQQFRKLGIRSLSELERYESDKKRRDQELSMRKHRDRESMLHPERAQRANSRWLAREREELARSGDRKKVRKIGAALEFSGSLGSELLSEKEKNLCAALRIWPQQYMIIKETLLRENLRAKCLKKTTAKQLIKIESRKTDMVFDFFEANGWINKPPSDLMSASAMGMMDTRQSMDAMHSQISQMQVDSDQNMSGSVPKLDPNQMYYTSSNM